MGRFDDISEALNSQWSQVVDVPINDRSRKPRLNGITMVIDKGLGVAQVRDLVETAGSFVDLIKLAFGSSVLYPDAVLRQKITVARAHGIEMYPGGTLFEVAYHQGRLSQFLDRALFMGFRVIEVSDGTIELSYSERKEAILEALGYGFRVLAEVGKKDPVKPMTADEIVEMALSDLELGAFKVIIEARDSGTGIGIYDESGAIKESVLEGIAAGVGSIENIIWEAPQPRQQRELILRFGANVNLGNVQPADVMTLESMRVGLRSDTFRTVLTKPYKREESESGLGLLRK